MAENCTCGDFVGEDPFCKEHGSRHGHWPVLTWSNDEGGIELADCPECDGEGEYDARADIVTCQNEDCGYASRGPMPADAPEASNG